ncbi:hypothetical protein [Pseudoduganella violacea]|uniref:Uncharacterized protein n=1 Tax=Pseudoduganella violacea TaxID=1715466 RepID=A0A7W5FTL2_9BURK|nr:hypothetical protein [Pseudoduganella violacea]MBB3118777.1 hypothetical protein [Pseudoduganella violacea]
MRLAGTPRLAVTACLLLPAAALAENSIAGTLRTQLEARSARPGNPLGMEDENRIVHTGELRWQFDAPAQNALRGLFSMRDASGERGALRINELTLERPFAGGFLTAGKKVMSWDVGYAFRPLDVIQQEDRRAIDAPALDGVPMLAWEAFDAERAITVVLSNPGHGRALQPRDDGALAVRLYRQRGKRDEYAVLRLSRRNGVEAGLSFSHVLNEGVELHGSALWQQRHDTWLTPRGQAPRWQPSDSGGKALAGFTWTTERKYSLLGEAWLDRTAAPGQQRNMLLRLAHSGGELEVAGDVLWQPQNDSRIASVAAGWRHGRWQLNASWRHYGGVAGTLVRSLGVFSAQLGF